MGDPQTSPSPELRGDVAALYVDSEGPYPRMLEHWYDEGRDARTYAGPHPVVCHPPCKRWGRFWWADGSKEPGNDGGLFGHALEATRRWGGVIEHPDGSHAWRAFDLPHPVLGAWVQGIFGDWATCVAQSAYGHRARKMTWLLYCGDVPPAPMDWRTPKGTAYLCAPGRGSNTRPDRPPTVKGDTSVDMLTKHERIATPDPFAIALIELAASARRNRA